ncbi:MAG TPA: OmpA family protein [Stellaceae bacterium]|nr:OmpA family protein [Stellaceae bacterium]
MAISTIGRWFATVLFLSPGVLLLSGCVDSPNSDQQTQAQLEQLQAANRQLQSENAVLQTQLAEQQQLSTFTIAADMLFVSGGFDITPKGRAALDDIAPKLRSLKNNKVAVYGYTDSEQVGASLKKQGIQTNLELSSRRADAVVKYLVAQGVNASTISAKGRGDSHPVGANDTAAGRAQNRRIEIVVEGPRS